MKAEIKKLRLDLKVNWKLSRNETLFKENFIIKLSLDQNFAEGEVAPNVRYGETIEIINQNFNDLQRRLQSESIEEILIDNNFCNSFSFALSSAHTHLLASIENKKTYEVLGLSKPKGITTSYTVPIMEESQLRDYLKSIERFKFIKVKVNKENAISFCKSISLYSDKPLRIDANEGWETLEEYLSFEEEIQDLNVEFIEQPFPADKVHLYKELKDRSRFLIIADESITRDVDFDEIESCFHGVNVKLMKAGSYENGIKLLREARKRGLKTMLGCMIETSLGISSALNLYELVDYFDLDGSLLIKNDPYDLIHEKDGIIS